TAPGVTQSSVRKRFYFEPRQVVVLAATFLLSLAVVFYLGILTGESFQKKTNGTVEKPEVKGTAAATMERFASTAGASTSDSILPAQQNLQPVESGLTGIDERQVATTTKNTEIKRPAPAKVKSAASPPTPAQREAAKAPAVGKEDARTEDTAVVERETTWSVQLGAGTAKKMIKDQIARLKTKGYQGYVVEAERDGQTWYRIRVGRFGTRAEAETLRQALDNQEGFKSPVTIGE
ncbi:MAG TPA: SPOR domain-containing protein, partial [Candidatus Saccharimonadales bacterium]|nr:SPOR domain-containing protein [Candidatus Saccharimonadales bacterium]